MAEQTEPVISQEPVVPTPQVTPAPAGEPQFTDREKQYFERIKKLEQENTELKKPQTPVQTPASTTEKPVADFDTLANFVEATQGLAVPELNELRSEAKLLGVDPLKYISSKSGQSHLKELRQKSGSTAATPNPSHQVKVFNGKPVDSILTDPAASKDDKQAAWEAKLGKGQGANSAQ